MALTKNRTTIALTLLATAAVTWSYWTTLTDIVERWTTDPQYSHGFLVPLFAGYLLWIRRGMLNSEVQPRWWGVGIVAFGLALRMAGHYLYQTWLDSGSFLVVLAGFAAAAGGKRMLLWAAPAILFLCFMIPLPYRAQLLLGGTLQTIATQLSTYALQTCGVPAVAEGNVILLTEARLGVVEACGGLSMLVTFFALATAVAIITWRNWLEATIVFLSAIPIAIAANVTRITVTGMLFESNHDAAARAVFHDLAGWLMMPLALVLLIAELYVLRRVIVQTGSLPTTRSTAIAPIAVG